jgi:hypothetical protein
VSLRPGRGTPPSNGQWNGKRRGGGLHSEAASTRGFACNAKTKARHMNGDIIDRVRWSERSRYYPFLISNFVKLAHDGIKQEQAFSQFNITNQLKLLLTMLLALISKGGGPEGPEPALGGVVGLARLSL